MPARPILHAHDLLGETPVWHEGRLYWIDIMAGRLHALRPGDAETSMWELGETVGFAFPIAGSDDWVAGLTVGLARVRLRDDGTATHEVLDDPEPDLPTNRFNDGCVDARGRLWCGTMDEAQRSPTGALYVYDGLDRRTVAEGIVIPNGPAFTPDGEHVVFAATQGTDRRPRGLYRARVLPDGTIGPEHGLVDWAGRAGRPDGMAVDAGGRIWVGVFGGGAVLVFDADGAEVDRVDLPTDNPTRPCFGGPGLTTLYVPTDCDSLTDAQRAAQPEAGSLFAVEDAGPGLPGRAFRL